METVTLSWQGINLEVSCKYVYPIEGFCHIVVKCSERLPITETGYKSHFMPMTELEDFDGYAAYVTAWLEQAAQSQSWQRYVKSRLQGDLFDF